MSKRTIKDVNTIGKIPRDKINSVVRAVHVTPISGDWHVLKSGKDRVNESFPSRDAAIGYARNISQEKKVDLIVHYETGNIKKYTLQSAKNAK